MKVKLAAIAVKVSLAQVVKCPIDPTLQKREETLHALSPGSPLIRRKEMTLRGSILCFVGYLPVFR